MSDHKTHVEASASCGGEGFYGWCGTCNTRSRWTVSEQEAQEWCSEHRAFHARFGVDGKR